MILAGQIVGGRFEIRRRLGAGGMGEVFEAFDRERGERVALKTLTRADGDAIARFKREFRALQTTEHPNLVSLRELVSDGEHWFFTMELLDGRHFLEHVRGDIGKLRAGLRQLVHGLRALHDAGLVHRDVKPSNVMVTDDARVVLLDFGLVTDQDPMRQSVNGVPVGTVEYMAPEQALGRPVTAAVDWYGVGVMLYEALTGQVPHTGHVMQILVDKQQVTPVPPEEHAPGAPRDLCALCVELLRIEPGERPGDAEVARRLGADERGRRTTTPLPASTAFVGRERELAVLGEAFERARDRPVVQLVVGESGMGKSELVAHFTRQLGDRVVRLAGRCYERESVPYKALDGVADGLVGHLARLTSAEVAALLPPRPPLLARLFPVFQRIEAIASAPAPRDEGGDAHEQRRRMFGALRHMLAALAASHRVVVTIDDLQWADADSFLLLRELLRGAGAPRLLVLATVRGQPGDIDDVAADDVAARLDGITVRRVELGPLTLDESRVLAESILPDAAAGLDFGRIAREAAGHPMFLHELLRHAGTVGAATTLDDALGARIGLLRPDARAVLEVVCVAGAPIALDLAGHTCRLDAAAVGRAAASLRVASLAREVRRDRGLALEPYHDRVREAGLNRLDDSARIDLHARLATALESSPGTRDPQLLFRHFMLARLPERAARYAEEAAQRSLDAHAFDQAAELWRAALDLVARDPDDLRRIRLRLGEALANAGRGAEAAEHYLDAARGADRPTRLECHRNAAEQLLISGRISEGIASLGALLSEIGVSSPATPRRALFSLLRHRAQLRLRGLGFRDRHRKEIADSEVLVLDVLRVAANGLAMVDSIRGADFQTRNLLFALRAGHRPHIARALLLEAVFQATNAKLDRAVRLIARAREVAPEDSDDPYIRGMYANARGMVAYFAGRSPEALEHLGRADGELRQVPGANWERAGMRLFSLFALRFVGDYAEMRRRYEQYAAESRERGDRYDNSTMRRVCVPMWLAADDPAGAAADLERATWVPDSVAFHTQHFHEMVARGEIALYSGERGDQARLDAMSDRLGRSLLLRITSIRAQHDYLRGRLALAGWAPIRDAERAARRLAGAGNPNARVWSLLLAGGVAAARGDAAGAAAILGRADVAAVEAGMRLSSAAARRRIAELRGDDALAIAASADMAALGVRAPLRMTALLAPGGLGH